MATDRFGRNVLVSVVVATAWFVTFTAAVNVLASALAAAIKLLGFTYAADLLPMVATGIVLPALFALLEWNLLRGSLRERLSPALAMPILPAAAMWYCCVGSMELLILVYGLFVLFPYWAAIGVLAVMLKFRKPVDG